MDLIELKGIYARIYVTVARESQMRSIVFAPGHPKRERKIKEIERLLADIDLLKDELKLRIMADRPATQSVLLDSPERISQY